MCSDCAEHFEVDEEHAFGSAFSFEEGAFVSIKESADDSDAVALFQFHFLWMEVGDVVLHFGGGVDEEFHLARGNLENLEFAVHFLVAVGDEGVLVLQRIDSAERGEDKDSVGDERTLDDLLLAMNGRIRGCHGTVCTQSGILHHLHGERFLPTYLESEPLGLVLQARSGYFCFS